MKLPLIALLCSGVLLVSGEMRTPTGEVKLTPDNYNKIVDETVS